MIPVTSPTSGRPGVARMRLEKLVASGVPVTHPVVQALAGRIHGMRSTAVPQKGSTTPASVAWHRVTEAQPGYYNRRMRQYLREKGS